MGYTPGQRHTNAQNKVQIEQRRKLVAANLLGGLTYAEIGRALNVSKATIASDYKAILAEWRQHYAAKADDYLGLQLRRLDTLLNALWDDAKGGNLQKLDRVLAIMDRQSALLGLSKGITLSTNNVTVPIQIVEVNLTDAESPLMLELGEGTIS
jgi:hypothetical protein